MMTDHTPTPWVIPTGEQNAFIICSGDNPDKPGDILMVVRAPVGRRTVATDRQVDANVAMMVKAVNAHDALVTELKLIADWRKVSLAGEYEHSLRDVIRSMLDCADRALATIKERA